MSLSPVILFIYNRPELLEKTLAGLLQNRLASDTDLIVYADGAKNTADEQRVEKTRKIIDETTGFKSITKHYNKKNLGLANSIIKGVTEVIRLHENVIVLEDDLLTSPNFLSYMNEALDYYRGEQTIFSISGYSHPVESKKKLPEDVFFVPRAGSWGWATWKNRWDKNDWAVSDYIEFKKSRAKQKRFCAGGEDLSPMLKAQMTGSINSWAIRWNYTLHKLNGLCVYPKVSKVAHIGNTPAGTHVHNTDKYDVDLDEGNRSTVFTDQFDINREIMSEINDLVRPSLIRKIINYFKYDLF